MQHISSRSTQSARTSRRRRLPRFLQSVSPAAVAVTVSLLIGGAGFADAATGGTFILGKANKETSTASLADSKGTPLALFAPHGKPPLAVNRNVMVKNLNAQYLSGLTATGLAVTGGEGFTAPNTDISIGTGQTVVARTGKLAAGIYYVTATAQLRLQAGDSFAVCNIVKGSDPSTALNQSDTSQAGDASAAETAAVKLTAGDRLEEICFTGGNNGSLALDSGILAIRVLSSNHQ